MLLSENVVGIAALVNKIDGVTEFEVTVEPDVASIATFG